MTGGELRDRIPEDNHVAVKDQRSALQLQQCATNSKKSSRQDMYQQLWAAKGPSKKVRLASSLGGRKLAVSDTGEIDQAPGIKPAEAPGIRSRRHWAVHSSSGCFSYGCHHLGSLSSWEETNGMRQHGVGGLLRLHS